MKNKMKRFVIHTNTRRVMLQADSHEEASAQFMEQYGYDPGIDLIEVATND